MNRLFYSPGACSLAPHVVLEEIGLPYETVRVAISEGATATPEFLALNPRGKVPVLESGGRILLEAPAILAHLGRGHPEAGLWPSDPWHEAEALSWMAFLSSSTHVGYGMLWRTQHFTTDSMGQDAVRAAGRVRILSDYKAVEAFLAGREFATGNAYGVLDPYLLVFFRWGCRIGLDMGDAYPNWTRHARRVLDRPAVQRIVAREGIEIGLPVAA